MRRYVLAFVLLIIAGLLSSCTRGTAAHPPSQTHRTPDGIAVTPVEIEPSDAADVLDLKIWKAEVTLPASVAAVSVSLELHSKGQAPKQMLQLHHNRRDDKPIAVLVGMYPPEGTFWKSGTIKMFLRAGPFSTAGTVRNVFAGKGGSSGPLMERASETNDTFLLTRAMKSNVGYGPGKGDPALILRITKAEQRPADGR